MSALRALFFVTVAILLQCSLISAQASFTITAGGSSPSQYNLVGQAHVDPVTNTFVLTDAANYRVGGIWFNQLIKLAAGFNITIKFRITHDPSNPTPGCRTIGTNGNADGLVFVLNANSPTIYGSAAEDLGYNFANNFAVEFDTYTNGAKSDPNGFHVGIQSCGSAVNSANHAGPCALAVPVPITTCYDNIDHVTSIVYDAINHKVSVFYDYTQIFNVTYNIGASLALINGDSVYAGFTSSTGGTVSRQEVMGLEYHDLNLISCPFGQLVNYTDNTCYSCPPGYFPDYNINKCNVSATTPAPTTPAPTTAAPTAAPGSCITTTITVTTSDEFQAALATHCNIIMAPGNYFPPTNGAGFKIIFNNTNIRPQNINNKPKIDCGGVGGSATYVIGVNPNDPPITIGLYLANVQNVFVQGLDLEHCETGVYADWYTQATFDQMLITNNFNHISIGSGFHTIVTSNIVVTNSRVINNVGYAGVFVHGTASISNSNIDNNSGGGVQARYSAVVIIDGSTINSNYGSGIYSERSSSVTVTNTIINKNYGSYFGGGIEAESSSTITTRNATITENSARNGGGVYSRDSTVSMTNGRVTDNTATNSMTGNNFDFSGGVTISNTYVSNDQSSVTYCCDGVGASTIFTNQKCSFSTPSAC